MDGQDGMNQNVHNGRRDADSRTHVQMLVVKFDDDLLDALFATETGMPTLHTCASIRSSTPTNPTCLEVTQNAYSFVCMPTRA